MSNLLGSKDYFFGIAGFCTSIILDFTAKIAKNLITEKVHICKNDITEKFYLITVTVFQYQRQIKVQSNILIHEANYFHHLKISLTLKLIIFGKKKPSRTLK